MEIKVAPPEALILIDKEIKDIIQGPEAIVDKIYSLEPDYLLG